MGTTMASAGSHSLGRGNRRTKLLMAAFLALVSATLAFVFLQQGAASSHAVVPGSTVVLTAAREIAAQSTIQPEMVVLKRIPLEAVVQGGFRAPEEVVGTVARYPIGTGEQITAVKVSRGRPLTGLTAAIPDGHRAMAISSSAVVTAGGMLQPGDRVDVLAVVTGGIETAGHAERIGEALSVVLVEDAEVLAVAQRLIELALPPLSGGSSERLDLVDAKAAAAPSAATVTLALTPQEAQRVLLYEQRGVIRLIVRPPTVATAGGQ
ncbi:MAG: Flp pilus assembly protein CpaB [Dehalococcoidia bacterium]|nr:MAG: Flp pilus assembly protein CpaB [Dehalococcoidia bacterium]